MDKFLYAVDVILEHEGGFVDNKHDPGGATNYGISLRWLKSLVGDPESDVDQDGDVDADDIKHLTPAKARKFYQRYWWDRYAYNNITNIGVATKVFDMSVNMGGKQAHKLTQRAMRAVGVELVDDGILGPISFDAINKALPQLLIPALRCTQAGFYYALVMRNEALRKNGVDVEDFSVFLKGWLNRAYS